MRRTVYRYVFVEEVSLSEVQDSLLLAIAAAEGLHGAARLKLEAGYLFDEAKRTCVVDASTPVGEAVARIFTGFLSREFGERSFTAERVGSPRTARPGAGVKS